MASDELQGVVGEVKFDLRKHQRAPACGHAYLVHVKQSLELRNYGVFRLFKDLDQGVLGEMLLDGE